MADTVYLLHFKRPFKHAKHYCGFTTDLRRRLTAHAQGKGARLMEVITSAGIEWQLARTWAGGRDLERRLKNRKEAAALCPICSGEAGGHKRAAGNAQPRASKREELAF